jgi:hypothetical protein
MSDIAAMALKALKDHSRGLHVDELALRVPTKYQNLQIDAESLS